jgi:hypothetical protein
MDHGFVPSIFQHSVGSLVAERTHILFFSLLNEAFSPAKVNCIEREDTGMIKMDLEGSGRGLF